MSCTEKCWADARCTGCGRIKIPRGRSLPIAMFGMKCDTDCPGYYQDPKAPHLWGPHDSDRAYTDPKGWEAHIADCERCKEE